MSKRKHFAGTDRVRRALAIDTRRRAESRGFAVASGRDRADAEKKRSISPPRFARFLHALHRHGPLRNRTGPLRDAVRRPEIEQQVRGFLTAVHSRMGAGLAITAITAWSLASSPQLAASALTGVTLSFVLLVYTGASVASWAIAATEERQ